MRWTNFLLNEARCKVIYINRYGMLEIRDKSDDPDDMELIE
jgi:hypothetical protein